MVANLAPLSADEAYYWVWSRALAPGYLDHPPMVAMWIAAGTALAGDGALGVRLLAPPAAVIGSLLLAGAARDLLPGDEMARRRAGLAAAALMNATLLVGIGSATMTPDTPLLLFWTATLWALGRLHATGRGGWWLVAGAAAGLAGASKYSAVLMLPGIALWLLAIPAHRTWLRHWHPWVALALGLAVVAPVLAWNAAHEWVSVIKQASRGGQPSLLRLVQFQVELIAGQLGLATPIIALLGAVGVGAALVRGTSGQPGWVLIVGFSAMPAVVFVLQALGERVQANWPGIVYPAACIAAAGLGARWQRWVRPGVVLGLAVTAAVWLQATLALVALPLRLDPTLLRLGGWPALAATVADVARREGAGFVAADNYGHAALLARLLPADIAVVGVEGRWALFRLADGRPALHGQTGLLVRGAGRDNRPDLGDWASLTPLATLDRAHNGMTAEGFRLYRGTLKPDGRPAALMPRPR